jgi:hypothetical protein
LIDFTPYGPGGKVYVIVILWIVSGVIGFLFRLFLYIKFRTDLQVSEERGASEARKRVSRRLMESSILHMAVKAAVILIGVGVSYASWNSPEPIVPLDTTSFGLLLIPWALTLDGVREYFHQMWLLNNSPNVFEAGRLYTAKDLGGEAP